MDRGSLIEEIIAALDDLIWRLAIITAKLHDNVGDREALQMERSDLMREAKELGLFRSRYGDSSA